MPENVKPIETVEEYEDAVNRVARLDRSMPRSPEEEEQKSLMDAVAKWERDHATMPKSIRPGGTPG